MKKLFMIVLLGLLIGGIKQGQAHDGKMEGKILPVLFKAPDFVGLTDWINSKEIKSIQELKGRVVLVDFWTFGCINCIHTLPYVQRWHETYKEKGLVVLGVHAPEFAYERKKENVIGAVKKHGLTYPVVIDNGFRYWRAYGNRFWPAFYLIDKNGMVRYKHFGEGRYKETEEAIKFLLGS